MNGQVQNGGDYDVALQEPTFCTKPEIFSSDLLEDFLFHLVSKSKNSFSESTNYMDYCATGLTVELIFNICKNMKQKEGVKYLTVELFDRFLLNHIQDLYTEMKKRQQKKDTILKWEEIEARIQKQMILRIVSCMQIASKINHHYELLTAMKCRSFLASTGNSFTLQCIINSELRVLKTLDYNINIITPLSCMEMLLEIIGRNDPSVQPQCMYNIGVRLLDFVYITRDTLYRDLYHLATSDEECVIESPSKAKAFSSVKHDKLFLTTAVVASAAYFVSHVVQQKVLQQLHHITKIPLADIMDFSCLLLKNLLDSSRT